MAASKKKKSDVVQKDATHIKFVPRANMWVRTTIAKGVQKQEWFMTDPREQ